jgi:hypothetical protein
MQPTIKRSRLALEEMNEEDVLEFIKDWAVENKFIISSTLDTLLTDS